VANHVWVSRNNQYDQGFDVFHPIDISAFKPRAPELNKKALAWIHQNKSRPFFAYLHYMDTHEPYTPPEPYNLLFKSDAARPISNPEIAHNKSGHFFYETGGDDLNHYIDQYDGEISYVDHFIGRLLEELKEHGLTENTILIITSDHGESFFEHGYGSHGFTVYNPEIDIPLIVKFPKSVKLPDIQDHNLELMDIPATILAILNYSFPYPVSGINLLNTPDDRRAVFSEEMAEEYKGAPKIAMIKNGFKAIFRPQQQKVTELYNAATDKSETTNLVSRHPDMAKKFAEEILSAQANRLRIKKELGLKTASKEIQDPGKINQLKALGYIQ
jgi:arylsulfatase A-like enzyme